ncbi:MAG: hypothetical protein LBM07_08435 [Culturomica sp.]|jgi:hypothetical protein|nr:hypothetical protein [Culturomica sp.]
MGEFLNIPELLTELESAGNERKKLKPLLNRLIKERKNFYKYAMENDLYDSLHDLFYKALLLDLDEDETESIEIAEMAYVAIGNLIKKENNFEYLKRRILLLHYFYDYFTDAIIAIFLEKYRSEHAMEARNLAIETIRQMILSDISTIETVDPQLIEKDEQLCDVCNSLANCTDFTPDDIKNAGLILNVLHAYLKGKNSDKTQVK